MSIKYRITAEIEFDDPKSIGLDDLISYASDLPPSLAYEDLSDREWFRGYTIEPIGDFDEDSRLPRVEAWR